YAEARIVAQDADERYNVCAQWRGALQARYAAPYFSPDLLTPIAQRFREHYQSVVRYVRPQYYQDMARLRALAIGDQPGQRRPQLAVEADLYQAMKLLEGEAWLSERRSDHARALGRAFAGAATNWPQVRAMLTWTDEFQAAYSAYSANDPEAEGDAPGAGIVRLATGPASVRDGLRIQVERLGATWEQWRQGQAALERLIRFDALPDIPYAIGAAEPLALANALERLHSELGAYWAAVDAIMAQRVNHHSRETPPWADLCADLVAAQGVHAFEAWLAKHEASLRASLGVGFKGNTTDWAGQLAAVAWVERFLSHYPDGAAPDALARLVSADGDEAQRQSLRAAIAHAQAQLNAIEGELRWTDTLLPRRTLLATGEARGAVTLDAAQAATPLAAMRARVVALNEALPQLRRWLECTTQMQRCRALGLGDLLDRTLGQRPFPATIVEQFEQRFYRLWLDEVWRASDTLRLFSGAAHERVIARFQRNDEDHTQLARERLRGRLMEQRRYTRRRAQTTTQPGAPTRQAGAYQPQAMRSGAVGDPALARAFADLQREVNKKRHQLSIRGIVRNVAPALLELKPCWMMSPLTVSQFVDGGQQLFDLVIFDEASQVSPEDAICAILRGKQLIVVGDMKQLPPTRFFSKTLADDEDDEDLVEEEQHTDDTARSESILQECSGVLLQRSLKWHYRSHHESLIAFSNHEFYGDELITFPLPEARSADGVRFVYVADAVYDRSRTRTNRQEAERVVDTLFEIVRKTPNRSLGVVALSSAQENAIRDALESRFKREPMASAWRDELNEDSGGSDAFFIKNLESAQGDERDVIILSVGYGRDRDGRLPSSFGPIDRAGGERRLNVAITRARYQMVMVSSLRANEIPLTASHGRRALRRYLDYAARGTAALADDPLAVRAGGEATLRFESPFEQAVYTALTARGLALDTQVGCSGYRIDLAVRDPERPDVYLLGVE
ncbi:MAG TPA: AAA domain-containing protein, partial [Ktedonobacterales bacterium]|nr:AAA domain-containing protein [Ktedonobacterales bacterium]